MKRAELAFHLPDHLQASMPPEARGVGRDGVRLLVMHRERRQVEHARFHDLDAYLRPGDLLVVNASKTLPASLPAVWRGRPIRIHLSTNLRDGRWIVEPRRADGGPDPDLLRLGDFVEIAGLRRRVECVGRYRTFERLWVVRSGEDLAAAAEVVGEPIRYGYVAGKWLLCYYQTLFARVPGSAEMPSAARPFTKRVLGRLARRGVRFASILLHTGVSSHEVAADQVDEHPMYPEWYEVTGPAAQAVNETRQVPPDRVA